MNNGTEYNNIELSNLPINPVKDENGEELKIYVKFAFAYIFYYLIMLKYNLWKLV